MMAKVILVVLLVTIYFNDRARSKRIVLNEFLVPEQVDFPQSMTSDFIKTRMSELEYGYYGNPWVTRPMCWARTH